MAGGLTPPTLDLEVRGSILTSRVGFLDKEVYGSTVSLLAQMYKWVPAWGILLMETLLWTSVLSRGSSNTTRHPSC